MTSEDEVRAAVAEAHLPTLAMSIVHLTGDASILDGEQPSYALFGEGHRMLSSEKKHLIRERAVEAILAHRAGRPLPPPPGPATVSRMMNFIAGAAIPDRYGPFLAQELALDGLDRDKPDWTTPRLCEAAADMFVVVIGAGLSGILAGIRLKQAGIPFAIVEKNSDVGGTWFENTYPGCRVDSTNHMYAYSFLADGHAWPHWYSPQTTLLDYFRKVADRYGLRDAIQFATEVREAIWDETGARWRVRLRGPDGSDAELSATAVISAVGQLNQPKLPDIAGLASFAGESFHSARWRHDVDLAGRTVAVIGTGASAFQFVPEIAPKVAKLSVFQRSPPWIMPTKNYHDPVGRGFQWLIDNVPSYERWWRFFLFWSFTDGVYEAVRFAAPGGDSQDNRLIREQLERQMRRQLDGAEHLAEAIIPTTPFGSKRALRDNGAWIATLQRENVDLVTTPIDRVDATGIVTRDGTHHAADILIYGTGFRASEFLRTMRVVGRAGAALSEVWAGDARAHLGIMVPDFPNFFMVYGPNTNIVVNGSVIFFSECAVRYIVDCLRLQAETGARSIGIKPDVFAASNRALDERNACMAWGAPDVSNWYKNASGRVSQNWPFPIVDYWYATREAPKGDFELSGLPPAASLLA